MKDSEKNRCQNRAQQRAMADFRCAGKKLQTLLAVMFAESPLDERGSIAAASGAIGNAVNQVTEIVKSRMGGAS